MSYGTFQVHQSRHGQFIVTHYCERVDPVQIENNKAGIEMQMRFKPNGFSPASRIALIQTTRCRKGPSLQSLTMPYTPVGEPPPQAVSQNGWHVDAQERESPGFGLTISSSGEDMRNNYEGRWSRAEGREFRGTKGLVKGELGCSWPVKEALLRDDPQRTPAPHGEIFLHEFEVVAVTVTGDKGRCLGVLKWGYVGSEGRAATVPIKIPLWPSDDWFDACERWNQITTKRLPVPLPKI